MKICPNCSTVYDDAIMECSSCYCDLVYNEPNTQATNTYSAPNQNYSAPNQNYSAPNQNYSAPNQNYSAPNQNYGAPYQNYGAAYGAPQTKYCFRCGNICNSKAVVCVKCGAKLGAQPQEDVPSTGMKVLCFFLPILALIFYITDKDNKPNCAKSYGKCGLAGFLISGAFYFFIYLIYFFLIFVSSF